MRYRILVIDSWIKWYKDGLCHRLYGPAVESAFGGRLWRKNHKYHREDGPAYEDVNGKKEWYINDLWYNEEEFKKEMKTIKKHEI